MTPKPLSTGVRNCARLISLAGVTAAQELGAVASLAQHVGSSALVIAELAGDSATLGRFQRPGRSGHPHELRRSSGGRSTRSGDGIVSLSALIPSSQTWLGEAAALSGPRLLNRLVRGLLAGLTRLGLAASYPGRDFISVNGRRIAYVALSRAASGVVIFQAVLAVDTVYTTAEREPRWPGLPAAPEPTSLARERTGAPDFAALSAALAAGFAERFSLELDGSELSSAEQTALSSALPPRLVDETLAQLKSAGPVAIPIGELEAHAALDAKGRFARVRLGGDWMAALPELESLETALVGESPESARVRELCADWLAHPASLVVGLTDATTLADAIARSARAYSALSPVSD